VVYGKKLFIENVKIDFSLFESFICQELILGFYKITSVSVLLKV